MRTLLLADDSITVQRVIALTFAAEQIRVVAVGDGQQAMEQMAAQRPDIVLAGTTLPRVSGYDLAKFMRGNSEFRMVPVLLLSGAFETVDQTRFVDSGANGILEKPVEPTAVISRVKELLGMKPDENPAPMRGRYATPANAPAERKLPVASPFRPLPSTRGPSQWDQLRDDATPDPRAESVDDSPGRPADYLDTLDAAFDSLDQQLSGRRPDAASTRNPSGPIGQSVGAADPRSPGRTPSSASSAPGNPVFEVDDDWFGSEGSEVRSDARAGRREIAEDLSDPGLQAAAVVPEPPAAPVFEVDDEWFAEDDKARASKQAEHQQLAKEMGLYEVELPEVAPATAAGADRDFDFGIDDFEAATAPESIPVALVAPDPDPAPTHVAMKPVEPPPPAVAPPPPEIKLVAPEITGELLDQIASRVTERLNASAFGEQLKDAMLSTMRETVRSVVSETSERIVRDVVPKVVAEASERLIRESAPSVVAETSERVVREAAPRAVWEVSDRLIRESVPAVVMETTDRVVRESAPTAIWEVSDRLIRETASSVLIETTERVVRESAPNAVSDASDRQVRDLVQAVVAETSDRLVRESVSSALADTTDRLVRDAAFTIVSETSERVVRESVHTVVPDMADRMLRDTVPTHVSEASERQVRDRVTTVLAETAERLARETVRTVVSDTSERLIRDEIERIKSESRT